MNLLDVMFLDMYKGIRANWAYDVFEKGNYLKRILPETTLSEELKAKFKIHLEKILKAWENNNEFEGAFDLILEKTPWYDEKFYYEYSVYLVI